MERDEQAAIDSDRGNQYAPGFFRCLRFREYGEISDRVVGDDYVDDRAGNDDSG